MVELSLIIVAEEAITASAIASIHPQEKAIALTQIHAL